ncbi:MAG: hypothetical protein JO032_10100 [Alphaproteobacteria bacterium]|nr:hypothetical protein [Alphaproteobacteria bacterium]
MAGIWGELSARRPLPAVDTLIAATALGHELTPVTRNCRDVAATGVDVLVPGRNVERRQTPGCFLISANGFATGPFG